MTMDDIDKLSNFVDENRDEVIIKVIGVGGGGDNAVNHMYEQGINKVAFVVCNTDRQALNNSPVPNRLLLGPKTTRGLGAGNKPELARMAAEESADEIAALFDDETKMVFITAGMGGGTGTGAAPVVARIAQERGLLTIGIVTIPFFFEGEKKILKALDGAEEMSKYVDALLVVNNEQLTEIYPDLDLLNAFGKADDTLSNAARSISQLITCDDALINLDYNDVDTTLRHGEAAIISTGYGEGEHRVTKAIEDALHSPLLKNKDIYKSKHILFNIYYSRQAEQAFVMGEANELSSFIAKIDRGVDVIYGIGFDDTLGNKIKITILASGFPLSIKGERPVAPQKKGIEGLLFGMKKNEPEKAADNAPATVEDETESTLIDVYGDRAHKAIRERALQKYIILQPHQFDDDAIIEIFEHSPAFTRDIKTAESVRNAAARKHESAAEHESPEATRSEQPSDPAGNSKEIVF